MSERLWLMVAATALLGCGEAAGGGPIEPVAAPERTAAQDRALRGLAVDVAEAQACDVLRGAFLPVPEERVAASRTEQPSVVGRLWVSTCAVERRSDTLSVRIEGQGWQWIDRTSPGPLGSSFRVRGPLRFQARVELEATVDLRYETSSRRVLVALTPTRSVQARVTPIGAIPVEADGGWSGVVGGLASLFGSPVEEQARPVVEEQGALMVQRQLRSGATFALDLCTGQLDGALGALDDGEVTPGRPYAGDTGRWLDNARVLLRPGTFDLAGPFTPDGRALRVDVEVEAGSAVVATLSCRDDAERFASEYLSQGAGQPGAAPVRQRVSGAATLTLEPGACDEAFLRVEPTGEEDTRYRYRVRRDGERAQAWVRCE